MRTSTLWLQNIPRSQHGIEEREHMQAPAPAWDKNTPDTPEEALFTKDFEEVSDRIGRILATNWPKLHAAASQQGGSRQRQSKCHITLQDRVS